MWVSGELAKQVIEGENLFVIAVIVRPNEPIFPGFNCFRARGGASPIASGAFAPPHLFPSILYLLQIFMYIYKIIPNAPPQK